jgi:hypothetical protein
VEGLEEEEALQVLELTHMQEAVAQLDRVTMEVLQPQLQMLMLQLVEEEELEE